MTLTGKVKFFDSLRHFGYIIPDNPGPDVFVWRAALNGSEVTRGQRVSYGLIPDQRGGVKAIDVSILEDE